MKILKKLVREDNFLSLTGNIVIAILGIGALRFGEKFINRCIW
jgi:hypothetical protein